MKTLGDFIIWEMKSRNLSAREFATLVGVSHTQINKFSQFGNTPEYSKRKIGDPSLDFLSKLATATGTDLCALVALIYPKVTSVDAETAIFASRYASLTDEQRDLVTRVIKSMGLDESE